MSSFEDITQEEWAVFLQEADEQLQLLDEDLITLEKEGANTELLQEIFRAAHTLKGSAAMVGREGMALVAHAAETVLDQLRNHTLAVSTPVIDALLYSLDALKSLREEIISGEDSSIDIESVIAKLETVGKENIHSTQTKIDKVAGPTQEVLEELRLALERGQGILRINVEVAPESQWPAVRCFQVLNDLSRIGELIHSAPSQEEIENGQGTSAMEILLASQKTDDDIKAVLGSIPELNTVKISSYDLEVACGAVSEAVKEQRTDVISTEPQKALSHKPAQIAQTVRVDVKLLDTLMNLVGEMVIDRNRLRQISKVLASEHEGDETIGTMEKTSAHIMKLIDELQDNVMKARMLPIGTVFNGLPRLVRDLAQKANKKINIIIEGHETELDRAIIEQIRDPLVHLLRNAVDHGIEPQDKRKAAGKPEEGILHVLAYQEQNCILIVIDDNGGGIDSRKVKDAAIKKGLISTEKAAKLTDDEAINLIFASGLSTAERVTEVSGRGVGMDVVKTNIDALGGTVNIESKPGEGTRVIIKLPLTLVTTNGLMVSSADTIYIVPMSSLVEVLKLKPGDIKNIVGKEVIRVRDNILPLLRLDNEFSRESRNTEQAKETIVVVIESGHKSVGLVVDYVIETIDTVVKSLGKYIGNVEDIAGATILGDGRVALILDTAALVKRAMAVECK